MSVSVVTVCLNSENDLPLTLESAIAQDHPDLELIVVDGGSWDGTAEVLARYADSISQLVRISDAGIFDAMNKAVARCTKDYVLFLNAGDRFCGFSSVSNVINALRNDPDVIYGDHVYINGREQHLTKAQPFAQIREQLRSGKVTHLWHSSIPCHQATFTRRSLLARLKYDVRLEICADHDFMFRAYDAGARFQYVDELVCHYMGGGYSARRIARCQHELASVYRRLTVDPVKVDDLFFSPGSSPFSEETVSTGFRLGGFYPMEGPYPQMGFAKQLAWCSAQGFSLLSPIEALGSGCVIEGYTSMPDQRITATLDGEMLAQISLPVGHFTRTMNFDRFIPERSVVRFSPSEYGELSPSDRRVVSMALVSARFITLETNGVASLGKNKRIATSEDNQRLIDSWCIAGWSQPEPEHIWSEGRRSQLLVSATDDVDEVRLTLAPNPAVPADERMLTYLVNGDRREFAMDKGDFTLDLSCADPAWLRGGVNLITFTPERAVAPSVEDPRLLGICLKVIETI